MPGWMRMELTFRYGPSQRGLGALYERAPRLSPRGSPGNFFFKDAGGGPVSDLVPNVERRGCFHRHDAANLVVGNDATPAGWNVGDGDHDNEAPVWVHMDPVVE